jgi:hypothetical protein
MQLLWLSWYACHTCTMHGGWVSLLTRMLSDQCIEDLLLSIPPPPKHTNCSPTASWVILCPEPSSPKKNHSALCGPSFSLLSGPTEKLSSLNFHCLTFSSPHKLGLSRELQEVEDTTAVPQHSLDEVYSCHGMSDFHQPASTHISSPEEQFVCCILDLDGEYSHWKENKSPNGLPCSFPILYLSCLLESSLCCKPCRYTSVWVKF